MTTRSSFVRGRSAALTAAVLVLVISGPAFAAWDAGSTGAAGVVRADSVPAGSAPTSVTRLGRDVDVSWSQVDFLGQRLGTYTTGRYAIGRNGAAAGGGCAGSLSPGDVASSTCRDVGLAPGNHDYTVTPGLASWSGATGSTTSVTIPKPSLTFSPATWSAPGTALQGTVDAFLDNAPLSYRLDDPAGGAVLTGTPTAFPTAPATAPTTSVSVGCGPSTGSAHTVYAISPAEQAAGAFSFDFSTILCPSSITSTVGAAAGRAQAGDQLSITFSRAVDGNTICSGLTAGTTTPGSLLATIDDNGTGNDTLTVSAPIPSSTSNEACGSTAAVCVLVCLLGSAGTVTLGTLSLGSTDFATGGNVTFTGSRLALDAAGSTVTLTLGTKGGATNGTAPIGSIATYTPVTAVKSASGLSARGYMTSGQRLL